MTIQWSEDFNSREIHVGADGAASGETLRFTVWGDTSQQDIYQAVAAPNGPVGSYPIAPYTWDGWNRNDVKIVPAGGPVWKVTVDYGASPVIAAINYTNTFTQYGSLSTARGPETDVDMTGGTAHITQSLLTVYRLAQGDVIASGTNLGMATPSHGVLDGTPPASVPAGSTIVVGPGQGWTPGIYDITSVSGSTVNFAGPTYPAATGVTGGKWTIYGPNVDSQGGSAPSFMQAIGVSLDAVNGCDVIVPKMEFTVSGVIAPFSVAEMLPWYYLIGTTNQNTFWGFQVGEVLYQGPTAKTTDGIQFRVTHKFAASPTLWNLKVTPTISIPEKGGWDYVWCSYGSSTSATLPIQVPVGVYVEQVYSSGDFSQLGLGG